MRKRILSIGCLALFVGVLTGAGFAQVKIAVVNSQDVLEKSAEGRKIIARLTEADKQNTAAITKLDDEIRTLQTKLNTQRITLTDEAVMALSAELDRKNTDRKRKAEDAYSGINELQQRLFKRLQDELIPIVEQLGKEKGMDVIFDLAKSGAVYWSPAIDFTAEVIKRYDASKAVGK
ncbi:MAG: OmpH family outer membrane protein [Candidatus Aminicenantes bacterium]|nr:OmpH family outer membrane protein [Candidatus Aminicenantes bacterium]